MVGAGITGCQRSDNIEDEVKAALDKKAEEAQQAEEAKKAAAEEAALYEVDELTIEDTQKGKGRKVREGDTVTVDFTGMYRDGFVYTTANMEGGPAVFTVGKHEVLEGWELGVIGMQVGGKRTVKVPPELGYGENVPHATIPPGETLIYDFTLLKVVPGKK
jgi:peptidylprolyl isomerase